ncbi:L-aspartate oxidase [Synechococcus sp. MIT S9509]|uniref:L-aspartate oxidase n=1 Tax=Synechococcus sp. MIT S9509 TaxID=1801630 RepID=UPI0007BBDD1D|nr:L-aspartate oxidase [Synechococcus sp. MIT S9509]KZR88665.1 L-aspartate oxidase [Synechococcus sp. MIT S9509]
MKPSNPGSEPIPSGPWDVVVVGAGAAGLMTCLELPDGLRVLLVNRNTSRRSSSRWAQGGIASVTRRDDNSDSHATDTIDAGAGLCDGDSVRLLVEQAPQCVDRLLELGMDFDRNSDGSLATTLEAAHSHHRVLHVQDRTGHALVDVLRQHAEQRPGLLHRRGVRVSQLWVENGRCCGVQVLDGFRLQWIRSRAVILATGGGGHLYTNTTNPAQAAGEGIALAWAAGAAVEDLEFVQFHPTALKLPGAPCFLISEAVRGEGGRLVDAAGNSPVTDLPGADLAPRDQVSRALLKSMRNQDTDHVGLDLSGIPRDQAERRFPTILERCRNHNLNPLEQPIPVAPAAHYWMGGVATDLNAATSLPGLYAVGEVACTGLHGANRLASNSLMECLVFARQLGTIDLPAVSKHDKEQWSLQRDTTSTSQTNARSTISIGELTRSIDQLSEHCWDVAGVNRSRAGMQTLLKLTRRAMSPLEQEVLLCMVNRQSHQQLLELEEPSRQELNLLLDLIHRQRTTALLLEACLFRTESRGGHFRSDAPCPLPQWRRHSRQLRGEEIKTRSVID